MLDCSKAEYLNLNIIIKVIARFTHIKKNSFANLIYFNEALDLTAVKTGCECTTQQQRLDRDLLGAALCVDTLARRTHALLCFWIPG